MEGERLYKVLDKDGGLYHHDGFFRWPLPHDGQPGEWAPPIQGELVACVNGYHLCRDSDVLSWLGPTLYEAESRGERLDTDAKIVVREARLLSRLDTWNERSARLFACDCAERVLYIAKDERLHRAIEVARQFANGEACCEELAAASAAAWAAARATAWDAARAAAEAAAEAAARAAAWDAARATAWDAARATAWDAERQWQGARLLTYLFPTPAAPGGETGAAAAAGR